MAGRNAYLSAQPDIHGRRLGDNPCDLSATYSFPGSYQYFVAMAGVPSNSQGGTVSFEVDDEFGDPLGDQSAQYGNPEQMHVALQGLNTIVLFDQLISKLRRRNWLVGRVGRRGTNSLTSL